MGTVVAVFGGVLTLGREVGSECRVPVLSRVKETAPRSSATCRTASRAHAIWNGPIPYPHTAQITPTLSPCIPTQLPTRCAGSFLSSLSGLPALRHLALKHLHSAREPELARGLRALTQLTRLEVGVHGQCDVY